VLGGTGYEHGGTATWAGTESVDASAAGSPARPGAASSLGRGGAAPSPHGPEAGLMTPRASEAGLMTPRASDAGPSPLRLPSTAPRRAGARGARRRGGARAGEPQRVLAEVCLRCPAVAGCGERLTGFDRF
jgi:hypothetical protein